MPMTGENMPDKGENSKDDIITEIRENYTYAVDSWREIREQAQLDMRYVSGDPWDPAEKSKRNDPATWRPCLVWDELSQYTNQLINDVRDQKRAIKVDPKGDGSNDKTAELRANRIRQIEYESNAQAAYITGFENAVNRSYGFARINTAYVSDESKDQTLVVERIANPDTVILDPDYKKADASDISWAFVINPMPRKQFEREWPDAEVQSFNADMTESEKVWLPDGKILVAEYWKRDWESMEWSASTTDRRKGARRPRITQYITNGFEILEETKWLGRFIPIIAFFGKELWIDSGGGSKRVIESLVRKARDPYMSYCWARSTEVELISMSPKTPWMAPEGAFEGHEAEAQTLHDTPRAFFYYKLQTDGSGNFAPPPTRQPYEPPIAPIEAFCEAARRGVQSAMGIMPLPTQAQRQNEKSGVALQRIQTQTQKGSFHFIDNFERSIKHAGRIMNDLLDKIESTPRMVPLRNMSGDIEMKEVGPDDYGPAEHEVTITTGPSYESERDQANQFVDSILSAIPTLPIPDAAKAQLLALAIKLKDLGPIGDDMVEIISPQSQQDIPPQAQVAIQQGQAQLQQMNAYAMQLESEIKKLQFEKDAKVLDNQGRMAVEELRAKTDLAKAEITTASQQVSERLSAIMDLLQQLHGQAHEAATQAVEQQHERMMADQQQQAAAEQQQSQQGHEQEMAAQQPVEAQ